MNIKVKGIARYSHLFVPSAPQGVDNLKYSIQLLIKKDSEDAKKVDDIFSEVFKNGFPQGAPEKTFYSCWTDLGATYPDEPILSGYMCLKLTKKGDLERPPIVDSNLEPITNPNQNIDGNYVWCTGFFKPYHMKGMNYGINCYLNGTLITDEKGELDLSVLTAKPNIEQMFGDVVNAKDIPSEPLSIPSEPLSIPSEPVSIPSEPQVHVEPFLRVGGTMTEKANGKTYQEFISEGWSREQLLENGYMTEA